MEAQTFELPEAGVVSSEAQARLRGRMVNELGRKAQGRHDTSVAGVDRAVGVPGHWAEQVHKDLRPVGSGESQLHDHGRPLATEKIGLLPGATIESLALATMRQSEDTASLVVDEVRPKEQLVIEALGSGSRLQVRSLSNGKVGWVSARTSDDKMDLFALKYEPPGEAYGPGAVAIVASESAIMRESEALASPKVMDCPSGERLRMLSYPSGRRIKVERLKTGEVGWVSATASKGVRLLKLAEEQPWRAQAFTVGSTVESYRTIILRAEESTASPVLKECQAGEEFVVVEHGSGFRLKVRHSTAGIIGWVSSASSHGAFLLGVKSEAFFIGQTVETAATVTVREGEDLASRAVSEAGPGEKCTILAPPMGRRVKVRFASTGAVGYVSSATKSGDPLLLPEETDVSAVAETQQASQQPEDPQEAHDEQHRQLQQQLALEETASVGRQPSEAGSRRRSQGSGGAVGSGAPEAPGRPSGQSEASASGASARSGGGSSAGPGASADKDGQEGKTVLARVADALGPRCVSTCSHTAASARAAFSVALAYAVDTADVAAKAADKAYRRHAGQVVEEEEEAEPKPQKVKTFASIGYTKRQANATFEKWEVHAGKGDLPPDAKELPGGCLFCMYAKTKFVKR